MKQVNVSFIGAGAFISATHLKTAGAADFINIRAIAELDEKLLAEHCSKYDIGYTTNDYRQLLEDPETDIIVIGTKQELHAKLIVEALDAGKWVWCEKPMCETQEEAEQILAAEERNPGKLAIGFNRRFAPAYTAALTALKKRPRPWFVSYRVQMDNHQKKHDANNFYFHRPAIIYEGCHFIDLATFIFGEAPGRVYMSGPENAENDCVILEYADGSRFQLLNTNTAGNGGLGKELAEFFAADLALKVDNFVDFKLRGDYENFDRIFPPAWGEFTEETLMYGYDFLETLRMKLAQPDRALNQHSTIAPVKRGYANRPYEAKIAEIYEEMKDMPWQQRVIQVDKGWEAAFQHFCKAFLDKSEPLNANGKSGKLANDIAFALLESKKTKSPVDFYSENRGSFKDHQQ